MTTTEPNALKQRLLIKTFSAYAEKYIDDMANRIFDLITDNLPEYADAIQAKTPVFWPWLVERSKVSVYERSPIDKPFWASIENEPDVGVWIADLWDLYLKRHADQEALFDLALHKIYENRSDRELEQIVKGEITS